MGEFRLRAGMMTGIALAVAALAAFATTQAFYGSFSTADIPGWPHRGAVAQSSFAPGGPLQCTGIERMSPARAGSTLRAHGYEPLWIVEGADIDHERVDVPPAGSVLRAVLANPGEEYTEGHATYPLGESTVRGRARAMVFVAPAGSAAAAQGWALSLPAQNCIS
jgi:hypothetical protein